MKKCTCALGKEIASKQVGETIGAMQSQGLCADAIIRGTVWSLMRLVHGTEGSKQVLLEAMNEYGNPKEAMVLAEDVAAAHYEAQTKGMN